MNNLININIESKGLSKTVIKLINTVKDIVVTCNDPNYIERKAEAKAKAMVIKAESKEAKKDIALRSQLRRQTLDMRRQSNIEAITNRAIGFLPDSVNTDPVDEDWVYQFYNSCQDIGNEEMQSLWAKILAGEVTKPKSFSSRTLNIVKMLHKDDANLFSEFCSYVIGIEDDECVYGCVNAGIDKKDVYHNMDNLTLFHLSNLGLVNPSAAIMFSNKKKTYIYLDKEKYQVNINNKQSTLGIEILTDVGVELFPISGAIVNEQYKKYLLNLLDKHKLSLEKVSSHKIPKVGII